MSENEIRIPYEKTRARGKTVREKPFFTKKFTTCELNYTALEKTCAAMVWVRQKLRSYRANH